MEMLEEFIGELDGLIEKWKGRGLGDKFIMSELESRWKKLQSQSSPAGDQNYTRG